MVKFFCYIRQEDGARYSKKGFLDLTADLKNHVRLSSLAKASVWYTASNIISRGVAFLCTPIFTRLLTPSEFGIYSRYVSWLGILTVITTFEIHGIIAYCGLKKHENEADRFISSSLGALMVLPSAALSLYMIFRNRINAITELSTPLMLVLFLQVFLNAAEGLFLAKKRYDAKYRTVSVLNILSGLLTPVIAFVLIQKTNLGGISRIAAPLAVSAIFSMSMIVYILRKDFHLFDVSVWRYLLRAALPILPHYIALSLMAQGDKIIISHALGDSALGTYYIAYSIAFLLSPLTQGISSALTSFITKKAGYENRFGICEILSEIYGSVSLVFLAFFLVLPEAFRIIAPENYTSSLTSVYPAALGAFFLFVSGILYNMIFSLGGKITKNTVISAICGFAFTVFAVEIFGVFGGALGTLFSYFLLFVLNFRSAKKLLGVMPICKTRLVNSTILLFFGTALLIFLRNSLFARLILLPVLFLFVFPEMKRTFSLFKKEI